MHLESTISVYPFGMIMPGRSYDGGSGYRYGFNGVEADNEMKGNGNSYDFGARMYDARINRFMSIDPLAFKHPELSPYHFVANSPIMNREIGGEDYIVSINHETKTITITSQLYVKKGSEDAQKRAMVVADFWNEKGSKFEYVVGKGKNKSTYSINFDVSVHEVENPRSEIEQEVKVKDVKTGEESSVIQGTPGTNSFEILPNDELEAIKKRLNRDPQAAGLTVGGNKILVPKSQVSGFGTQETVDIHEGGHTMGMLHFGGTAMHFATAGGRPIVSIPMIQAVLGNAGVTVNYYEDSVFPSRTKIETQGDAPENFDEGRVRKAN